MVLFTVLISILEATKSKTAARGHALAAASGGPVQVRCSLTCYQRGQR